MIFVDSGAFYALIDKNDRNHPAAKAFYYKVIEGEILATSLLVITETWLLINARLGSYFANRFIESVAKGLFSLLDLTLTDIKRALEIEYRYKEARFGFIDSSTFALLERHKIKRVFTFDRRHFALYRPTFVSHLEIAP
jgi:predicted nucleic acid-binding protein